MPTQQRDRIDTYVLYRSPNGSKFHRKAGCATDPAIPPMLDAGESLLSELELFRAGDAEVTADRVCGNCARKVKAYLESH